MILKTEEFKNNCTVIKNAIDSKNVSLYTETLELKTHNSILTLSVTNREYRVDVEFPLEDNNEFRASVNAKLFLDLISRMTSATISLKISDRFVCIKGNGEYKVPIIYNGDSMLELPKIELNNITNNFNIDTEILQSILIYNSKELLRGVPAKPVQTYYYIDEEGAITFTSGACVNSFTLEKPVKMLLSEKVVKLFKLFKDVTSVNFEMAQDAVTEDLIQTKVRFKSNNVTLSAILADCNLISTVPVQAIRTMATKDYGYTAVVNVIEFAEALGRLMLFNDDKNYGRIEFKSDKLVISDWSSNNVEELKVENDNVNDSYSAIVNMNNLSLILAGSKEDYITMCFGDHKAIVLTKAGGITDILPEMKVSN